MVLFLIWQTQVCWPYFDCKNLLFGSLQKYLGFLNFTLLAQVNNELATVIGKGFSFLSRVLVWFSAFRVYPSPHGLRTLLRTTNVRNEQYSVLLDKALIHFNMETCDIYFLSHQKYSFQHIFDFNSHTNYHVLTIRV